MIPHLSTDRIGRFTASRFGVLMQQPRSKAERDAGAFGATGTDYITAKAIERVTGTAMDDGEAHSFSSRRGLLLEPAAMYLLGDAWQECKPCTWQPCGTHLGSTPDALVNGGTEPMDLKCPANACDVVRFGLEVVEDDFDTLLAWNAAYAWQIMVQAVTCGSERAHLVYFTDRLPIIKITDSTREIVQGLTDDAGARYSDMYGYPWQYQFASDGFFFVARSFALTDEIRAQILSTLDRAALQCTAMERGVRGLLFPVSINDAHAHLITNPE